MVRGRHRAPDFFVRRADGIAVLVSIRPDDRIPDADRPEGYGHQAPGRDELAGAWPTAHFRRSRRRGIIWPRYLMTRTAATPRDTAKA
ncbi:MAG: hypothetical protein ACTHJW_08920, partial [Streptosporangiaceae bacterium]